MSFALLILWQVDLRRRDACLGCTVQRSTSGAFRSTQLKTTPSPSISLSQATLASSHAHHTAATVYLPTGFWALNA